MKQNAKSPEAVFTEAVLEAAQKAETVCGCRITRLVQNVTTRGAAEELKQLLARHRRSDCFDELAEAGHLEWSMEAIAVRGCFGTLFTDDEVNECLDALLQNGYFG